MRREPVLTAIPPAAVHDVAEVFALARYLAGIAGSRYGELAARTDTAFWPVRCVFEVLAAREQNRIAALIKACQRVCGRAPADADRRWTPPDLVPDHELSEIEASALATPFDAWALAVRHRERSFVFWTYVVAVAEDRAVRTAAEDLAREALADSALLRRERRRAWRDRQRAATQDPLWQGSGDATSSAPLLETLLSKDFGVWSQELTPQQRTALSAAMLYPPPPTTDAAAASPEDRQAAKRRALRRAEQLTNLYLEDADNAADHGAMELAQTMAARSIRRLAALRLIARDDAQESAQADASAGSGQFGGLLRRDDAGSLAHPEHR